MCCCAPLVSNSAQSEDCCGERDYRACENYRHNSAHIELERQGRILTAVHLASYNTLCIHNGDSALASRNEYYEHNHCEKEKQNCKRNNECKRYNSALRLGSAERNSYKLIESYCKGRKARDYVCEEYNGDTVSDTVLVDSLSEPHNHACACAVGNYYDKSDEHLVISCGIYQHTCIVKYLVVTECCDNSEDDRDDSGPFLHPLFTHLSVLECLTELRESNCQELNYYRCRNIR